MREGLEASLIIGILVAYIIRTDRKSSLPFLWLGVALAVALSLGLGAFLSYSSTQLTVRGEEIFAGVSSLAAVVLVSWMVFWMKSHARGLRDSLHQQVDSFSPMGRAGVVAAAFFAVAREGLETALFIYSNFKTVSSDTAPTIGLALGLAIAIVLGIAIYRRSVKLNLGKFFTISGTALLVVAAGVLSHGINELQNFGALPGAHAFAWNWTGGNGTLLVTLLDGTVGIANTLTWLQLIIWVAYLGLIIPAYLAKNPAKDAVKKVALPA